MGAQVGRPHLRASTRQVPVESVLSPVRSKGLEGEKEGKQNSLSAQDGRHPIDRTWTGCCYGLENAFFEGVDNLAQFLSPDIELRRALAHQPFVA